MSDLLLMPLPRQHLPLSAILRRAAMPFVLFAGVLAGLMILSWYLLMPLFTRVQVAGSVRDLSDLLSERLQLQAQLTIAEEQRAESLLPLHDPLYTTLMAHKRARPDLMALRDDVRRVGLGVTTQNDAIHIAQVRLLPDGTTVQITGDIRFVGPRSMTILAQFAEALKDSPVIASVTLPRFVREDDPKTGPHSPFTLTLMLR